MLLTYLDDFNLEPVLLDVGKIPKTISIYDCPDKLTVSEHYPPMTGTVV